MAGSSRAARVPIYWAPWLFEISHRFFPPIDSGSEALWGFDGPVQNRLGLAYAASDRVLIGVLRTNVNDNLELNGKVRLFEGGSDGMPVSIGLMAGVLIYRFRKKASSRLKASGR